MFESSGASAGLARVPQTKNHHQWKLFRIRLADRPGTTTPRRTRESTARV